MLQLLKDGAHATSLTINLRKCTTYANTELMKPSVYDMLFASARDYSDDVCWG